MSEFAPTLVVAKDQDGIYTIKNAAQAEHPERHGIPLSEYVSLTGLFGPHNSHTFAAAPVRLEALRAADIHFGSFAEITINGQHNANDLRVIAQTRAAIAAATKKQK